MPFKSEAQRRWFNANRDKLIALGLDVDHWNDASRGKDLPERVGGRAERKQAEIKLSPIVRHALMGGALGGMSGLGLDAITRKKNDKTSRLRMALLGALLGGSVGTISGVASQEPPDLDTNIRDLLPNFKVGQITGRVIDAAHKLDSAGRNRRSFLKALVAVGASSPKLTLMAADAAKNSAGRMLTAADSPEKLLAKNTLMAQMSNRAVSALPEKLRLSGRALTARGANSLTGGRVLLGTALASAGYKGLEKLFGLWSGGTAPTGPRDSLLVPQPAVLQAKTSGQEILRVTSDQRPYDRYTRELSSQLTLAPERVVELLEGMRSVRPNALANTTVHYNGLDLPQLPLRIANNPRVLQATRDFFAKNRRRLEEQYRSPQYASLGAEDSYYSLADVVSMASKNPGVLVHELGHAIDFNGDTVESRSHRRLNELYQKYAPTLWTEHAAWNKGHRALDDSIPHSKLSADEYAKIRLAMLRSKRLGMGSYWGSALGTIVGAAMGTAGGHAYGSLFKDRPLLKVPAMVMGGAIGGATGYNLGARAGSSLGIHMSKFDESQEKKLLAKFFLEYQKFKTPSKKSKS